MRQVIVGGSIGGIAATSVALLQVGYFGGDFYSPLSGWGLLVVLALTFGTLALALIRAFRLGQWLWIWGFGFMPAIWLFGGLSLMSGPAYTPMLLLVPPVVTLVYGQTQRRPQPRSSSTQSTPRSDTR